MGLIRNGCVQNRTNAVVKLNKLTRLQDMLWRYFSKSHYCVVLFQGLLFHELLLAVELTVFSTITGSFQGLWPWVPRIKGYTVASSGHREGGADKKGE
jgi:hypothetical protein